MKPITEFDLNTMALTVWAEARGERLVGIIAVADVIKNRYESPKWWSRHKGDGIEDDTIAAVCRDPKQFSCWNDNDPQSKRLKDPKTLRRRDVQYIKEVCKAVLKDPESITKGANHYCRTDWVSRTAWARGKTPTKVIGNHSFFKL